jgi:hypothetical protein
MATNQPNRPTLAGVRHMPIHEVIGLPVEHLASLHSDARNASVAAKRLADWIEAAIALRYLRIARHQPRRRRGEAMPGDASSPRAA